MVAKGGVLSVTMLRQESRLDMVLNNSMQLCICAHVELFWAHLQTDDPCVSLRLKMHLTQVWHRQAYQGEPAWLSEESLITFHRYIRWMFVPGGT